MSGHASTTDEQTSEKVNSDYPGHLLIFSGPSGVGKTTITRQVEKKLRGIFSISTTTRPQTREDVEGVDYYFVDRKAFEAQRDQGAFLEWADVFGHYYGTLRKPVIDALSQGKVMLLEIDVLGAIQIKEKMPQALALFVLPPSEEELLRRLHARNRESDDIIQKRFAKAKQEIQRAKSCKIYDHFIVNDVLETAVKEALGWLEKRLSSK